MSSNRETSLSKSENDKKRRNNEQAQQSHRPPHQDFTYNSPDNPPKHREKSDTEPDHKKRKFKEKEDLVDIIYEISKKNEDMIQTYLKKRDDQMYTIYIIEYIVTTVIKYYMMIYKKI